MDSINNKKLEYASIYIPKSKQLLFCDKEGYFSFKVVDSIKNENILFSCVGYRKKYFPISLINQSNKDIMKIYLSPYINGLDSVLVKSNNKNWAEKTQGSNTKAGLFSVSFFSTTDKGKDLDHLGREIGTLYTVKPISKLKKLKFYTLRNDFNSIAFRLNVYSVKNNFPDTLLQNEDIILDIDSTIKKGWIEVNLEPYNIIIKNHHKIAITLQWVSSTVDTLKKNKYFIIPATLNPIGRGILARDNVFNKWKYSSSSNISMELNYKYLK